MDDSKEQKKENQMEIWGFHGEDLDVDLMGFYAV